MKNILIVINAFLKNLILLLSPGYFLAFLKSPFLFISNILGLTQWIRTQNKKNILTDYFCFGRNYNKRYQLYQHIVNIYNLNSEQIDFIEFGVCGGSSFSWWLKNNVNKDSRFYGFDTFTGLPEKWGMMFKKGDLSASIPTVDDERAELIKGLFQETLPGFLRKNYFRDNRRKIIHLDADLYSSTLYALSMLSPFMNKGDILFFDEFNVPNHEYYAFKCFSDSFYVNTEILGAMNNYHEVAMIITDCPVRITNK